MKIFGLHSADDCSAYSSPSGTATSCPLAGETPAPARPGTGYRPAAAPRRGTPLDGRELALVQDHILVGPAVGANRRHAPAQALAELLLEHPDEAAPAPAPALRLRLPALLRVGVDPVGRGEQVHRGVAEPALRAHEARLGR
ncbi:hypothetical protein PG997_011445 [Apiospora hydei]|uniref:Uncharacterized protein n=1 Tax=Apiospora hydei TaxID=1337664 RepID=A0ABR1VK16_9PEZI